MAKQLKVEDNYVVHYDTTAGEYVESFAINHCVYRETELAFIILEQIDKETLTINKADVISGAWIDGNSIAYTEDGIRTFLQQSTGFNTASGGSDAGYEYLEVALTDVQIKTLGTPIDLIAAQGVGTYFEYFGSIEFTHGTIPYAWSGGADGIVVGNFNSYGGNYFADDLIGSSENRVVWFSSDGFGQEDAFSANVSTAYSVPLNEALKIFTYNNSNPINGDGTILIKVWYKVKTFGTEL